MKIAKAWLFAIVLAASVFACGDDDDDDDTPDAAQADDAAAVPDAPPPIDADITPDAVPPGAMTLTVTDDKFDLEGIDVVFSNRDGTLISHMQTDANGEATETVPGRAFVTIFNKELPGIGPTLYFSYTLGGVMPGDDITINVTQIAPDGGDDIGTLAGTATINWPGEHAGATEYTATDGCEFATEADPGGGDPPDTTAELYNGCRVSGGTTWHVVASAFMSSGMFGGETLAASFVKNVSASDTVVLPAWNTDFEGPTVTLSNAPKGVLAAGGDGTFTLDGVTFDLEDTGFAPGGSGSYDVLVPQGFVPDSTVAGTFLAFGDSFMSITGFSSITQSQAGVGADLAVNLSTDALPGAIDGTLITGVRPSMNWVEAGDLSVANIAQITFSWDDVNEEHNWLIVTDPGDATPFQLPELPVALADFAPASDTAFNDAQAIYLEADYITDDWAAIRSNGGVLLQGPADENFVVRISVPLLEESAPLTDLPAINKRARQRALRR